MFFELLFMRLFQFHKSDNEFNRLTWFDLVSF